MKIHYNVTGTERKSLVGAISQELSAQTKYLGMPTAAYEVGGYTIDKTGTLTGPDNRDLVADLQGLHSFVPVSEEYDAQLPEAPEAPAFADLAMTAEEELGLGRQRRDPQGEDGMQASEVPDLALTIELPRDGFTDTATSNLEKLVESKSALIKKAVGAESLPIEQTDETLRFPWFPLCASADEVKAYSRFISALCAMAKEQKRITATEKPVDNEKYAFRCFLLRLGFIGEDYKAERKILLRNLSGNGSFKSGERRQPEQTASAELTEDAAETHLENITCETGTDDLAEALADAGLIHGVNALLSDNGEEETV